MLSLCLCGGWEGLILLGEGAGEKRADAHRGRVNALYFYFYRYVGGGWGDCWVWRVENGPKVVGGSAENFGHIGGRTHAKNLLCRLGVR